MLTLENISKEYAVGAFGGRKLTAVRDVSFDVQGGEVLSLIGESGSGKTTIGRMVLRLASISRGRILVDGVDVSHISKNGVKEYYRRVQGVFQDPFSSYNPIFKADRVLWMVREGFFPNTSSSEWTRKIDRALEDVRLDPAEVLNRYPHQLSGGQLQRMLIARALLLDIEILVADEIISMLDASTRIDVLNLLAELKERGLGVLFVTHDLSLGNYVSDRVVILRRGVVVEMGITEKVFASPTHPYSKSLLASVPQFRHKWAADTSPRHTIGQRCAYHELTTGHDCDSDVGLPPTDMVEIEPGHMVGCKRLGEVQGEGLERVSTVHVPKPTVPTGI